MWSHNYLVSLFFCVTSQQKTLKTELVMQHKHGFGICMEDELRSLWDCPPVIRHTGPYWCSAVFRDVLWLKSPGGCPPRAKTAAAPSLCTFPSTGRLELALLLHRAGVSLRRIVDLWTQSTDQATVSQCLLLWEAAKEAGQMTAKNQTSPLRAASTEVHLERAREGKLRSS